MVTCPPIVFSVNSINFKPSDFPVLSSAMKAWHVKIITSWLATKSSQVCTGSLHSLMRKYCCWGIAEYIHIVDNGGPWLTDQERLRAHRALHLHLTTWQVLAAEAAAEMKPNFKIRPKCHYLCHMRDKLMWSARSPKYEHCMMDEDFIGKIVRLCRRTHYRTQMLRVIQRYILLLSLRWHGRDVKPASQRQRRFSASD